MTGRADPLLPFTAQRESRSEEASMFSLRGLGHIQQRFLLACLSLVLLPGFKGAAASAGLRTCLPAPQTHQKIKVIVFSADGQFAALVRGALLNGLQVSDADPALTND